MKYEYLCGQESDFFTMPANIIAVVRLDYCVQGLTEFSQIVECGKPVLAMRRIIAEPKHWTWEDKKAGRLPDVGCNVSSVAYGHVCSVVAIDSNSRHIWCQFPDQSVGSCMIFEINPIETPAEKAQREEDEFVSEHDESSLGVVCMDSSHRKCYELGKRAAYRKLKGGE